ncbi:MAG: isoprenylcysteine carboxylmethyltransferase family protein [Clostridia bacterium]|nr:isoprenylcysteine carboxylmethyltransferase family protein [Clostridia bacterium]
MIKKILFSAMLKFVFGIIGIGVLVFLPAGTIVYWNGWLLLGVLFVPMLMLGIVLLVKNPDLLKKRLSAKETQTEQRSVIRWSAVMFLVGFLVSGLGYRCGWYVLPKGVSVVSAVCFLCFYSLYFEVLRENPYLSRAVEIQGNHKVIDSGLYRIVRHPMYLITVGLFYTIPLILGSVFSFFVFLWYPFLLVKRIKCEEQLLEEHLEGYKAYQKKVKYRLLPYLW